MNIWGQSRNYVKGALFAFPCTLANRVLLVLFASVFWTGFGEARRLERNLAGELQTHRERATFSGDSIDVVFKFIDPDPAGHIFAADLYQQASALAAPVVKDQLPVTAVANGGSVVGEVEVLFLVDLPAVERTTVFLLRMKVRKMDEDDWQVAGRITLVVHPPLDWSDLRRRCAGTRIQAKGDGGVGDFLNSVGLATFADTTVESPASQAIVLWDNGAATDDAARIESRADRTETVQHVFLPPLENLATEAYSQITLYRMMEAAIAQHNRGPASE